MTLATAKDNEVGLLMTRKTTKEMTRRTVDKILNNTKMAEAERAGMFPDKDRDDVSTDRAEAMLSEKTPGDSFTIDSDRATDRGPISLNGEKYEVGCSGGINECKKDPLMKKEARVIEGKETVTDDYFEAVQAEPLCQEQEFENMEDTDEIASLKLKEESFEHLVDNHIETDYGEDLCQQSMEENEDWSSMEISFSSGDCLDDSTTGARH